MYELPLQVPDGINLIAALNCVVTFLIRMPVGAQIWREKSAWNYSGGEMVNHHIISDV